jgi:hypothetical protein
MRLYLITASVRGWDVYKGAVVAARSAKSAARTHPDERKVFGQNDGTWVTRVEDVRVEYLGEARKGTKSGVILDSFKAG